MINFEYRRNPGRYGYIRSSEDKKAMLDPESACFDDEINRWFEHIGCEYSRYMDVDEERNNIEHTIRDFVRNNPNLAYKEVSYTLDYNRTGDKVVSGHFLLTEYENAKIREFLFYVRDLSMDEAEEYIAAAADWHYTHRFEIGRLAFFPCSGTWAQK